MAEFIYTLFWVTIECTQALSSIIPFLASWNLTKAIVNTGGWYCIAIPAVFILIGIGFGILYGCVLEIEFYIQEFLHPEENDDEKIN